MWFAGCVEACRNNAQSPLGRPFQSKLQKRSEWLVELATREAGNPNLCHTLSYVFTSSSLSISHAPYPLSSPIVGAHLRSEFMTDHVIFVCNLVLCICQCLYQSGYTMFDFDGIGVQVRGVLYRHCLLRVRVWHCLLMVRVRVWHCLLRLFSMLHQLRQQSREGKVRITTCRFYPRIQT